MGPTVHSNVPDDGAPTGGTTVESGLAAVGRHVDPEGGLDLDGVLAEPALGRLALVTSFGAESVVLLHLVLTRRPDIDVVFLETGKHFPETLSYRDQLVDHLGIRNLINVHPSDEDLARHDRAGDLYRTDPDLCCFVRKTTGLQTVLARYDTWLSGRKRFQGATRSELTFVERDGEHLKLNPLATWSHDDIQVYFATHHLPRHPLGIRGYQSIGCGCCTIATDGTDPRAGRWNGTGKTECGIHKIGAPETAALKDALLSRPRSET